MRKSRSIVLGLVRAVSAAAIAGGCGSHQAAQTWQTCVDRANTIVDERQCENDQRQAVGHPGYVPFYHYYYYRSFTEPLIGRSAPSGGSLTRPSGSIAHASGTTRGGFGSTAGAHGAAGHAASSGGS